MIYSTVCICHFVAFLAEGGYHLEVDIKKIAWVVNCEVGRGPWGRELGSGSQAARPWALRWAVGHLLSKPHGILDKGIYEKRERK